MNDIIRFLKVMVVLLALVQVNEPAVWNDHPNRCRYLYDYLLNNDMSPEVLEETRRAAAWLAENGRDCENELNELSQLMVLVVANQQAWLANNPPVDWNGVD
jgi:hypothetical protein